MEAIMKDMDTEQGVDRYLRDLHKRCNSMKMGGLEIVISKELYHLIKYEELFIDLIFNSYATFRIDGEIGTLNR